MNDILFVTLARGGSKGLPGKHLRVLGNKNVLEYTLEAVKGSKYYTGNNYVVSSDDEAILDAAKCCQVNTVNRPPELALDTTPTLPALIQAVEVYEIFATEPYKFIIEVRATSPLKTTQDIDDMVGLLIDKGVDSVIGVTELEDHHPARAKWLDDHGYIHDFLPEPESGRRQDLTPKAYVRNGTVYALKREALFAGKLFGHQRSLGYVMPWERSINIDTELDFLIVEALLRRP